MIYEPIIGLEVHLQLSTRTKAFCGCRTSFGEAPNSRTCPVCLGLPGSLPVLNEKAFSYAIKTALALDCEIQGFVKFDRKNYYYPDLPKNFQISQYDKPLAYNGHVKIDAREIRVKRVHLEEDAGKLIHEEGGSASFVDYNRAGTPLLEIVTEPDITSPAEAYDYLTRLKAILEYLDVSLCDMEKGSLRCDANISIRPEGETALGPKVELKNMNTFKGVREALEYEVSRQTEVVNSGGSTFQETRLWDAEKRVTTSMRTKEDAHDYRYFPEPDLVPFIVDRELIEGIRKTLPELPEARRGRFRERFGLSDYDAGVLVSGRAMADYFEECAAEYGSPKTIANWITGEILNRMNLKKAGIRETAPDPKNLAELLKMIDSGQISGKTAKDVLTEMIDTGAAPAGIVRAKGVSQISDVKELEDTVAKVLENNKKSLDDYRAGKKNAFTYLVGQVMKETKGRANPKAVNEILNRRLKP